jgi:hypothetical protein
MEINGIETVFVYSQQFKESILNVIKKAVVKINSSQRFYHLEFDTSVEFPLESEEIIIIDDIQPKLFEFKKDINSDFSKRNLIIVSNEFENNCFYNFTSWFSMITTYQLDDLFLTDYIDKYLVNSIICSLIHFTTEMEISGTQHDTLTGCIFDYTKDKKDKIFVLDKAHICPYHEDLINKEIGEEFKIHEYVNSLRKILE